MQATESATVVAKEKDLIDREANKLHPIKFGGGANVRAHPHFETRRGCQDRDAVDYFFAAPLGAAGGASADEAGDEGWATRLPSAARFSTTTVCSDCTSLDSRANTCTRLLFVQSGMSVSNFIFVRSPVTLFGK